MRLPSYAVYYGKNYTFGYATIKNHRYIFMPDNTGRTINLKHAFQPKQFRKTLNCVPLGITVTLEKSFMQAMTEANLVKDHTANNLDNANYGIQLAPEHVTNFEAFEEDFKALCDYLANHEKPKTWIAVIKSSAVRDVQYAATSDPEPESDDWYDMDDAEIFLGIFRGGRKHVLQHAAQYANTSPDNILLIRV